MSDEPIDPDEVNPQGELYRQLNQKEIEENAAKLLILVEQGGYAAYRTDLGSNYALNALASIG